MVATPLIVGGALIGAGAEGIVGAGVGSGFGSGVGDGEGEGEGAGFVGVGEGALGVGVGSLGAGEGAGLEDGGGELPCCKSLFASSLPPPPQPASAMLMHMSKPKLRITDRDLCAVPAICVSLVLSRSARTVIR